MTACLAGAEPVLAVVSIDTEEDNWQPARDGISVENIREIPPLQCRLERLGARPTYFTSYQVARVPWAAAIMAELHASGCADIGGHLHPWNTPPLDEAFTPRHTMMKNLPGAMQRAKLDVLTDAVERAIGARPTAFRAGRYGMGADGIAAIADRGYRVDSSVTPFLDWRPYDDGADYREAPREAYRPAAADWLHPGGDGPVTELPLSIGYTRRPFEIWHERHERLVRARVGRWSLGGLAYHTGLVRKVQLSFETDTVRDMLALARQLVASGARYLHVNWHSPSLVPGLSPFVRDARGRDRFLAAIDEFFEELHARLPLRFMTVSEAAEYLTGVRDREAVHVNGR